MGGVVPLVPSALLLVWKYWPEPVAKVEKKTEEIDLLSLIDPGPHHRDIVSHC